MYKCIWKDRWTNTLCNETFQSKNKAKQHIIDVHIDLDSYIREVK